MKISLRDLLLVTVIVALAVGWWVDHRVQVAKTDAFAKDYEQLREVKTKKDQGQEKVLRALGFGIEHDGEKIVVAFPPSSPLASPNEGLERQRELDALRTKLAKEAREKHGVP